VNFPECLCLQSDRSVSDGCHDRSILEALTRGIASPTLAAENQRPSISFDGGQIPFHPANIHMVLTQSIGLFKKTSIDVGDHTFFKLSTCSLALPPILNDPLYNVSSKHPCRFGGEQIELVSVVDGNQ
jgi:hypothetical protein